MVLAVRKLCEGILEKRNSWSADAIILAKAILAITHDIERAEMYPEEEDDG
jgi:hypothetical protein